MTVTLSLHQIAAFAMIYERFIRIGVIGPALVLVVPITLRILLFVLNFLTVDFGGVAFVVLSATAAAVVVTVKHFASSNEFFWESIFTNMSKLSYAIAFAAFITRLVFAPMLEWLLGWTSASALPLMLPTFVQSFWMTCIMLLLDTAVAMRYVGPLSIARCSTVPLAYNPLTALVKELWTDPLAIVRPNEFPGSLEVNNSSSKGRRYKHPTWIATIQHVCFIVVLGCLLAFILNAQWYRQYHDAYWRLDVFVACLATLFLSLPSITHSHELNPKQHRFGTDESPWEFAANLLLETAKTVILGFFIVVAFCSGKAWSTTGSVYFSHPGGAIGLLLACMGMSIYLRMLDRACRLSFFVPLADIKDLVDNHVRYERTVVSYVTVLVESILRYSHATASTVLNFAYTNPMNIGQWDQEEWQRTVNMGKDVAQVMVWNQRSDQIEAPLEEDIFQLTVLASLAEQNNNSIEGLVKPSGMRPPMIVPLVRALCVFLCGFVETLRLCYPGNLFLPSGFGPTLEARHNVANHRKAANGGSNWVLPPGLLCAVEWALQGLARCIVESCLATNPSEKTVHDGTIDWKVSSLALLIPTCFETMHAVHVAVTGFNGGNEDDDSPLVSVLKVCDEAALDVLKRIIPANMSLHRDTLEWAKDVRSKVVVPVDPAWKTD